MLKTGPDQNVPATKRSLVKTSLTRTKRTRVLVRTYLYVSQNLVSWNSTAWIKYYGYNVYYNKYFMCYWDKLIIPWIRYYNTCVTETLTNIYENIILWIVNEQFCELNTNHLKITTSNLQPSISCHSLIPYRYGVETCHLSNWIVRLDIYVFHSIRMTLFAPYIHTYESYAISMKFVNQTQTIWKLFPRINKLDAWLIWMNLFCNKIGTYSMVLSLGWMLSKTWRHKAPGYQQPWYSEWG